MRATGRNESRLDNIKASIRNGSTTGGALNSEPSNPSSVNPLVAGDKSVLGIGGPARRPVCGGMVSSVVRKPDDTGEWMEPHEFIRGRASAYEEDFINEETGEDLRKYMKRNPKVSSEDQHKAFRFLADIGASSMATWYQIAGVHGGGSPIMETITLMAEYDIEAKKSLAKYLAGIDDSLEQDTKFGADVSVSR